MRRPAQLALLAFAVWSSGVQAQGRVRAPAGPAPGGRVSGACPDEVARDRIERADATGEIALASGGKVRLVDIRIAGPEDGAASGRPGAAAVFASLAGQAIDVRAAGPADRWGRIPARIAFEAGGTVDLAELLVAEGLALVDVGERDSLCRPDLRQVERNARAARLGLWAAGKLPLRAGDPDALREAAGRFVIVEGRIASAGERKARTYLNFGRDFGRDFAVVIPKRQWTAIKRADLGGSDPKGRWIQVRGTIEVRRAPSMEIVAADSIEWQDPERP